MANLEAKKAVVDEIAGHIKSSKSIIFVDYRGITVDQDTILRKTLRANNGFYKVYKNRMLTRALDQSGIKGYDAKLLEGTTSVVFGADETTVAGLLFKAIKDFKSKTPLTAKFGVVNGSVITGKQVEELSKIPSKEVLIAMLLGMLNAPVAALARALDAIAKKGA